jgi:hypothetical protein
MNAFLYLRWSMPALPIRPGLPICAGLAFALLSACSTWRTVEVRRGWTLYGEPGQPVDAEAFCAAFDPAYRCVEETLGRFEGGVRVHAVTSSGEMRSDVARDPGLVHEVPGIGPARVRAWHARGQGWFGPRTGIYAEAPDAGTAVHELVHARFAEEDRDVPLWLEEGIACFMGDGFDDGERWIIDGFACWPVRELRDQALADDELARVLGLNAADGSSVRDNVLVHFVGWAIVFDLHREAGALEWRRWAQRYARGIDRGEARERILRTISAGVEADWLKRLVDEDRGVRMATAKGLWKLRSTTAIDALLAALEKEQDPEVRVAFAVNALAAAGEVRLSRDTRDRFWRAAWPVLRRGTLADAAESAALKNLYQSYRRRTSSSPQEALEGLRRFWAE